MANNMNNLDSQYPQNSTGTLNITSDTNVEYKTLTQKEIRIIGITDNEWRSVSTNVKEIYKKSSTPSIGGYIEGTMIGLIIPFTISLFKIINNPLSESIGDYKVECFWYFIGICILLLLSVIKKFYHWDFLSSYKDFSNDLKHTSARIDEINTRLGINEEEN